MKIKNRETTNSKNKSLLNIFDTSDTKNIGKTQNNENISPFGEKFLERNLESLKEDILKQGLNVIKSPVFVEVKKYQLLIRDLIQWVQKNSAKIKITGTEQTGGKLKVNQWVEYIDKESKELLDSMMDSQKMLIKYSDKIEKINGLIVNLKI